MTGVSWIRCCQQIDIWEEYCKCITFNSQSTWCTYWLCISACRVKLPSWNFHTWRNLHDSCARVCMVIKYVLTRQFMMGDKLSCWSTSTRFLSGLGAKKKVSPSSRGMALLNSGSSSSSPRWAIWYKKLRNGCKLQTYHQNSSIIKSILFKATYKVSSQVIRLNFSASGLKTIKLALC